MYELCTARQEHPLNRRAVLGAKCRRSGAPWPKQGPTRHRRVPSLHQLPLSTRVHIPDP